MCQSWRKMVEKSFFGTKCSDSDYSLKYFSKVRENVLESILRKSRPVFKYRQLPNKQSQWNRPAPRSSETQRCHWHMHLLALLIGKYNHTNATVIIATKRLASDELTDWRESAGDESIVVISFQTKAIRNLSHRRCIIKSKSLTGLNWISQRLDEPEIVWLD